MAVSQDQIKKLLGYGLANEVVASTVGCSPSYISQLLADEQFAEEVSRLRVAGLARDTQIDDKLADIEETLIDNLSTAVKTKQIYKPQDVLRCFQVINAAKRRGARGNANNAPQGGVVQLVMPVAIQNQFITNSRQEVVEVAGKSLVTISPDKLLNMLSDGTNETDKANYKRILDHMPATATVDRNGRER